MNIYPKFVEKKGLCVFNVQRSEMPRWIEYQTIRMLSATVVSIKLGGRRRMRSQ